MLKRTFIATQQSMVSRFIHLILLNFFMLGNSNGQTAEPAISPEARAGEDTISFWDMEHLEEAYISTEPKYGKDKIDVGRLDITDKDKIVRLAQEIANDQHGNYDGLLISHKGQLVFESYYKKGRINLAHGQASATKGYTSLLVGRAIALGYLSMADLDKPLVSFLKDLDSSKWVDGAEKITLHKAMTMHSGIRIGEDKRKGIEASPENLVGQGLVQVWLENSEPITDESQSYLYGNDPDLVMPVLDAVVPGKLEDFIKNELLDKLGITNYTWENDITGLPEAGWRVKMTSRDMLKWGQLVLNQGKWKGKQLISQEFLDKATSGLVKPTEDWMPDNYSYGYYWYHMNVPVGDSDYAVNMAWGGGGQYVIIIEELDLVIAITGHDREDTIMTQVSDIIIPAFTREPALDQREEQYQIAFSMIDSGKTHRDIFISDGHGKSTTKITDFPGGNGYSAWSPDGSKLAFYAKYDDRKTWSIHIMNADGSDRRRLTHMANAWDNSPTWSPDGRKIAFARAYRNPEEVWQYELWIMNADGTDQQQIEGLVGGGPHFAPDGRIVYHSQPAPSEIYIANVDGSNNLPLTDDDTEDWHPEVSANGEEIAFMSNRDGNHEIYVMNIDGADQRRLTYNEVDDWYPSWSPDGAALIFSANTNGERYTYRMDADGSGITPIIKDGSQAVWLKMSKEKSDDKFTYPELQGPYMGQTPPGMVAEPFAPGIISTEGWEVEGLFSPGMNEFYYTTSKVEPHRATIVGFRREGNTWRKYIEFKRNGEPAFTPDGSRMLMADGYKDRKGGGWTERQSFGPLFNREDWGIMRLTASSYGTYVFDDYKSNDVIRMSRLKDGIRQPPVLMDGEVNSGDYTAHPFIAPDESYLIWDSERKDGFGDSDLYIRFKEQDDSWGSAINMGEAVNTDRWEAYASVTSDGKYMLFNRGVDPANDNTDIYWVDAKIIETLRPQPVTESTASPYNIAYGSNGICLTNAEGTSMKRLTNGKHGYPAWSPDGTRLAFYGYHDERKTWSIHTVNRDGTGYKRLTHAKYKWDNMPTWSPDGHKIVYAREYVDENEDRKFEIWSMNTDGSEQTQLNIRGGGPSFLPDGRLVFHSEYASKESEISIADIDGSNLVHLTNNEAEEWDPKVSPDGQQIVFTSDRDGNHEVYTMNLDGSNQRRLTNNDLDDYGPTWSPDGTQILFQSKGEGSAADGKSNLYIMNSDGSSIRQVISSGWQPAWYNAVQRQPQ